MGARLVEEILAALPTQTVTVPGSKAAEIVLPKLDGPEDISTCPYDDQRMETRDPTGSDRRQALESIRWHIEREDRLRAAVSTRAGMVLSTNAFVIAGTALAFSVKGSANPGLPVLGSVVGVILTVATSAFLATRALITPGKYPKPRPELSNAARMYEYTSIPSKWPTLEEFHLFVGNLSTQQQLQGAIGELWVAANHHSYRAARLREAIRFLLASIGFQLTTLMLAAIQSRQ